MRFKWLGLMVFPIGLSALPVKAANSAMIQCSATSSGWLGTLTIDSVGESALIVKNIKDGEMTRCKLMIDFFSYQPKAVIPIIAFDLSISKCEPESKKGFSEISLDQLTFRIQTLNNRKPEAKLQWLKGNQPENCRIEKLNLSDVSINAKKWKQKKWGR
jgi:hypothetical protein